MSFSGPILAVTSVGDTIVYACGNRVMDVSGRTITSLSPSTIVHNIRLVENSIIINGGREVVVLSVNTFEAIGRFSCRDWILSTTICDHHLFCVVMHNRVEIFSLDEPGDCVCTVACPTHALLYSAEIRPLASGGAIQVFGGGVLSSLYHWEFSFNRNHPKIIYSGIHNFHKGSIFKIRARNNELLTTSDDRTVVLWRLNDAAETRATPVLVIPGHLARVWDATWIHENIVSSCEDSMVRVFNRSGECIEKFSGHSRDVRCLSVLGYRKIFSGGEDGCLREWNSQSPETIHWELSLNHKDWIRHVEFYDKKNVVVVTAYGTIFIRNCEGEVSSICPESPIITTCAKIVFNRYIVLGLASGGIALVDLQNEKFSKSVDNLVPQRVCSIFEFCEPRRILVANHAGSFGIVDIEQNEIVAKFSCDLSNVKIGNMICALAESDSVLLGDDKGTLVRIRRYAETQSIKTVVKRITHGEKLLSIREIGGGELQVTTSEGHVIHVNRESLERVVPHSSKASNRINYLSCRIDSFSWGFAAEDFVVVDANETVQWSFKCGGHRRPYDVEISETNFRFVYSSNNTVTLAETEPVCRELVSGYCGADLVHAIVRWDRDTVFTACEDNCVRRIDMRTGAVKVVKVHEGSVRAMCSVPNRQILVSGGARSQAFIHHLDGEGNFSHSELLSLSEISSDGDDVRIMGVAATHDTVCLVDSTARIHFWNINECHFVKTITVHEIEVSVCLSVATDGSRFFVGAGNGFVVVLAPEGEYLGASRIHQNGVTAISNVGNRFMVSVSDDQSMAVWKFETNVEIIAHIPNASSCSIRAVATNGNIIATTGTDRKLTLWNFDGREIAKIKIVPTAVTDPLSIVLTDYEAIIAGRGVEKISLE